MNEWVTQFQKQLLSVDTIKAENVARVSEPLMRAAVLVPLVWRQNSLKVILTKRTMHLPTHAGEIAGSRFQISYFRKTMSQKNYAERPP